MHCGQTLGLSVKSRPFKLQPMKNPFGTIKYALVAVALFTIVGCEKKYAEVKPDLRFRKKAAPTLTKFWRSTTSLSIGFTNLRTENSSPKRVL